MTVAELCAMLVRVPTTEPEPTGLAIALCAEVLTAHGFQVLRQFETAPGIAHALFGRDGAGPAILIDGHIDTVPPGEPSRWSHAPLSGKVADGAVWGRGSADDKGPLAAGIMAACAYTGRRPLLVSVSGDEELHMRGVQRLLDEAIVQTATQTIALEPTDLLPIRAHKGNARIRVEVRGQSAHASRPWEGRNAVEDKLRLIAVIADWFTAHEGAGRIATFGDEPPTLVVTREYTPNEAYNVVPEHASYWYNYRPLPGTGDPFQRLLTVIREQAAALGVMADAEIEFLVPAFLTSAETPLIRTLERVSGHTSGWAAYGTHAGYFALGNRQAAVFGPGNIAYAHRENEHILISDLEDGVTVLGAVLQALE